MMTSPTTPPSDLSFSVVIPTLNAGDRFADLLRGLQSQEGRLEEIIVVDSSSDDDTRETARRHGARVREIARGDFDHGGTRNLGAREARGDVLLFLTQDAFPENDRLLAEMAAALADPEVAGCYARQRPRPGARPIEALWRELNYPDAPRRNGRAEVEAEGVRALFFSNSCACVRRSAFEEVGGFPERTICNEDMVMAWKLIQAGYRTAYVPSARILHSHPYGPGGTFRRYFDTGVFFAENPRITSAAGNAGEGLAKVGQGVRRLAKGGQVVWIPFFLLQAGIGLAGYQAGKHHPWLPRPLKRRLSQNSGFWSE